MTLQNLSGAIFGSLDKILLGLLFNTNVVGMYSIMISVTQLGHYVFASASSFIMPKISSCSTKKTMQVFYTKALVVSAMVTFATLFILTMLYPLVHDRFNLGNVKIEYFTLLISYGVLTMCVTPYNFALGFGKVKLLSYINSIAALIGIFTMMCLINDYGILGASIARLIYTIIGIITFLIPITYFKKHI
jgi:O-antigen/teichoic acid export membrane protein